MIGKFRTYKAWRYVMYAFAWLLLFGSGLAESAKFAVKVIDLNCGAWWAMVQQIEARYRRKTA